MDVVIMQIAIAEMLTFPAIPISVTINEFVDLAKIYSTPKSGSYINGMLDSIARYLIKEGMLLKPMGENPRKVKMEQKRAEKRMAAAQNNEVQQEEPKTDNPE